MNRVRGGAQPKTSPRLSSLPRRDSLMSEPEPLAPRWRLERAAHADGSRTDIPVTDGLALGRNFLGAEYGFVSRTQAQCRLVGSSLIVVSHGANPTGVKARGADAWVWIGKGQQLCVQSGDRIALDQRKLCSTMLTVHVDAPVSVGAAVAAAPRTAAPRPPQPGAQPALPASPPPASPEAAPGAACDPVHVTTPPPTEAASPSTAPVDPAVAAVAAAAAATAAAAAATADDTADDGDSDGDAEDDTGGDADDEDADDGGAPAGGDGDFPPPSAPRPLLPLAELVRAAVAADPWPFAPGRAELGVGWHSGAFANVAEMRRRIAGGEYSAAQALHRLSHGQLNRTEALPTTNGPPPGRPTLVEAWRRLPGVQPGEVEAHVTELKAAMAVAVASELGHAVGRVEVANTL